MRAALLFVLTFAFPSGRGSLFGEEAFDDLVARFERLAELLRLGAAAFGHVGLAAAAAADDGSQLLDDLPGGDALREVGRGAHDERSLAVGATAEHHDPRLYLREQRVRELAQSRRVEVARLAREHRHSALDLARVQSVLRRRGAAAERELEAQLVGLAPSLLQLI